MMLSTVLNCWLFDFFWFYLLLWLPLYSIHLDILTLKNIYLAINIFNIYSKVISYCNHKNSEISFLILFIMIMQDFVEGILAV